MHQPLALEDLPQRLRTLAEMIGLPATLKLVETYPGVSIFVPKNVEPEHKLATLLGLDQARALSAMYGGENHFEVPRAVRAVRRLRDRALLADLQTMSQRDAALKYQLTERGVRKICARYRFAQESPQAPLF